VSEQTTAPTAAAEGPGRIDTLLGGRVRLRQPASGYRAAIDPVFLAAAVPADAGEKLVELGCGVGAAALCLLDRMAREDHEDLSVTGLEIQPDLADLARENAEANGLDRRFRIIRGDIKTPPPVLGPLSFDGAFFNPPYHPIETSRASEDPGRALANQEAAGTLEDWLAAALKLLKPKGHLTLIHRADRLAEILSGLQGRAGAIAVLPLHPKPGGPAKRVLVSARKHSGAPLRLLPGLPVHGDDGSYSEVAEAILRDGASIALEGP
jgi:tRNA1(Val) A37 N6-methylase TrmN6